MRLLREILFIVACAAGVALAAVQYIEMFR